MIRDSIWPLSPAVHSTRKRRSASRGPDSWFAGGGSPSAATDRAGHAVARAAPSNTATAKTGDLHRFIGISPLSPELSCTSMHGYDGGLSAPGELAPVISARTRSKRARPDAGERRGGATVSELREPSALTRRRTR